MRSHSVAGTLYDVSRRAPAREVFSLNPPPLSDHEESLRPVPAEEHSTQRSLNGQGAQTQGESEK